MRARTVEQLESLVREHLLSGVVTLEVLHDADCPKLRKGRGACSCSPDIRVINVDRGPMN